LPESSIRVLLVEDFEQWRRFYRSAIQQCSEFQVVGEVSDGLEAVDQARQLQPDLILVDVGLPTLNGIEVARRLQDIFPVPKILFVSENRSAEIIAQALNTGAGGYVVKSQAAGELLPAMKAVLGGKRFVSAILAGDRLIDPPDQQAADYSHFDRVVPFTPFPRSETIRHHEVGFYSDDSHFLDHVTPFLAAALKRGNTAIVVATESHRESLFSQLEEDSLDVSAAVEQGRYIALDAAATLSMFMVNGMPDAVRFLQLLGDLITTATKRAKGEQPGVSVYGECVHLLWSQGNSEAAIQVEKLGNQLIEAYDVNILCGYLPGYVPGGMDADTFQRICAEHSRCTLCEQDLSV
jgi:DNA-binding NarL/FixJ family response regulator